RHRYQSTRCHASAADAMGSDVRSNQSMASTPSGGSTSATSIAHMGTDPAAPRGAQRVTAPYRILTVVARPARAGLPSLAGLGGTEIGCASPQGEKDATWDQSVPCSPSTFQSWAARIN